MSATQRNVGKILVLDADQEHLRGCEAMLAACGHEAVLTTTAEDALSALASRDIDIAILDLMRPSLDGVELCRHLRAGLGLSDPPVIFISSPKDVEGRLGALAGGDMWLASPCREGELLPLMDTLLEVEAWRAANVPGPGPDSGSGGRGGQLASIVAAARLEEENRRLALERVIQRLGRAA